MNLKRFLPLFLLPLALFACKKETDYQYEVDPVSVSAAGGDKTNQKTTVEFISIAYADLFGTNIPQTKLVNLNTAYTSFGDKKVVEDLIIRNFLSDTAAVIPSALSVSGDTLLFVTNTYKKFYNREPNPFEQYFWRELIRRDANLSPRTIYYALMTSDEYRFY